jgi:hypothetical protein
MLGSFGVLWSVGGYKVTPDPFSEETGLGFELTSYSQASKTSP